MENLISLFGGAILGAIIYDVASRRRKSREVRLLHKILDRLPDSNEDEKVKKLAGKLHESTGKLKKAIAENTSLKT